LFLGGFFGGGLDVSFILYDSSVGVASNNPGVVHEVGSVQPHFLPIFGFDCCDFGLGCEVELRRCLFHQLFNLMKMKLYILNYINH
jgi:hypothetical protein